MPPSFSVTGGRPLKGTIRPAGNKNAALPILAATLLADGPCAIDNVPHIRDVETMLALLEHLGAEVQWTGANSVAVNTARAELIVPGALLRALRKGRPGYAAVDVYEQEPIIDGNHPFFFMPNVLCTPHLGWAEWTNFELYFREAFEQIVAYQRGLPMRLGNPDVQPRN